jgi:hypothetical protein
MSECRIDPRTSPQRMLRYSYISKRSSFSFTGSAMDKETLVKLFERRDKKRRRILYEQYFGLMKSNLTASFIAEIICNELQKENIVNAADIKFCRYHFKNKSVATVYQKPIIPVPGLPAAQKELTTRQVDGFAGFCSDPDNMNTHENLIVESKFSKK